MVFFYIKYFLIDVKFKFKLNADCDLLIEFILLFSLLSTIKLVAILLLFNSQSPFLFCIFVVLLVLVVCSVLV
jgi:hypothetical protein